MPYGLMYGGPTDEEQDPAVAQVLELLRSLEPSPEPIAPTRPQQPGLGQRVFGGIGDALTSMASVRAGGGPIATGPFAARQQAQQKSYEEQLLDYQRRQEENAAADRTLRNTVRIGASQEAMRAKRELENAKARNAGRPLRFVPTTVDIGGTPTRVVDVYDPMTGEKLGRSTAGEAGYAPYFTQGSEGLVQVPKSGDKGATLVEAPGGGPIRPPASEETQQRLANISGFRQGISRLKQALPDYIKDRSGVVGLGQQVVRKMPVIGAQVSERVNRYGEQVAAIRDNVMANFIRIMSGLQASESEQARLARILPDLGTVDSETAMAKIQEFEESILAFVRERARLRPDLFSPEDLESLSSELPGDSPSGDESPEQKKARIRAKYGLGNP